MRQRRFTFGPYILDVQTGTLARDGRPVHVGNKAMKLLQTLLQAAAEAVTKEALMEAGWPQAVVEESNLTVQIAALRKILGPKPDGGEWIATVPRAGYRFAGGVRVLEPDNEAQDERPKQIARTQERPSIVVLPLANISGDAAQDYLADGVTEDIIVALGGYRWFHVIGRNSSFVYKGKSVDSKKVAHDLGVRYVLEGSLRKSADHIRVTAQLVDAVTSCQIWSERYEMELADAFAVQDAIIERVVGAIEPEILKTESMPAHTPHTGNVTAWDLVRQGTWLFHRVTRETHSEARGLFRQAATLDPDLAEAQIWLARVSAGVVAYGFSDQPATDIREGLDAAVKAIRLDERNCYSHYALAICSAFANAPEQAILAAERCIELNPGFALGHLVLGMAHLFRGAAREAISPLERGLTLNAHDPQNFVWYNTLALAQLFAGDAEAALVAVTRGRQVRPAWAPLYKTLTYCYASLGRLDEARSIFEQMPRMEPPSGDALGPLASRNPGWVDQMSGWLATAAATAD